VNVLTGWVKWTVGPFELAQKNSLFFWAARLLKTPSGLKVPGFAASRVLSALVVALL
jgi:hypothetical protein